MKVIKGDTRSLDSSSCELYILNSFKGVIWGNI